MRKAMLFALVLLLSVGAVSALSATVNSTTLITGRVYNAGNGNAISGANVSVSCTHDNIVYTRNTVSSCYCSKVLFDVNFSELICNIADINGDGKVDGADLAVWQQEYDTLGSYPSPGWCGSADINGDGKVDDVDLALWQQNYNPLGTSGCIRPNYAVSFPDGECVEGDDVEVMVMSESCGNGYNFGTVGLWNELDVAIIDVPLVPEFGFLIGMLTIVSAVGVFFFVRRE